MLKAAPLGLTWRSKTPFVVTTVALGLFTDLFLWGLPVPLLPYILQDRFHLPESKIQGHSSGLLATHAISSVAFCPIAGIFTDKCSGRKLPYLTGVVILLMATIFFFLGWNVAILFFARVLQGSSGALVWTVGQALLIDTVGADNVGKATGSIFGIISIGALAAPVLGGILYHRTGVIGPLTLGCSLLGIDLIMRLLIIEKKTAAKFGFDDGDTVEHRQHSNNTHEEGEGDPLFKPPQDQAYVIPPELPRVIKSNPILYCCKDVRMLTANWITLIQATLMGTFDATVPTIGEEYYAFNSLETGLLFIPVLLPGLILGPLAGGITDRRGPRTIVGWGYGLLAPMFILLQFVQPGGLNQVLIYCLLLFLCGTCLAVTNPPALVQATLVIEKYHKANPEIFGPHGPYAGVSSITGTMYNAGTALGSLLAGALKDAIGYGNMNLVMATLSLLTAVLGFLFIGERPEDTVDCSVD